jgi:hypothetical protein
MKRKQWSLFVLLFFVCHFFNTNLLPDPGPQQVDLVKLKKEEEERKKKAKKSKYVVTNETLKNLESQEGRGTVSKMGEKGKKGEKSKKSDTAAPTTSSSTISPVTPKESESTDLDEYQEKQKEKCEHWQKQKVELIYKILNKKADIQEMIAEYNKMANEFHRATGQEQYEMMKKADKLLIKIKEAEKQVKELETKGMEDLEEKARRDGIMPGCLREIEYPPAKD